VEVAGHNGETTLTTRSEPHNRRAIHADGKSASDYFLIDIENQASKVRTDYPTQKPEELLFKLISASTKPGGLVLDCFLGSGTTAAVAQKLGRRWIGCDINKGAIQTTVKRLGGSDPAPLLTLIVGPSEEGREVGATKKELAERYDLRQHFWTELLNRAKDKTKLHSNISPGQHGWIGAGSGRRGLGFNYVILKHEGAAELYIDRGKEAGDESKTIFDSLAASKDAIEKEFGGPLEWQRLEGKRACRIKKITPLGGYRDDESKWPSIQDAMIDAMIRLEKALKPYIGKLQL
jgi:hypothetical protein